MDWVTLNLRVGHAKDNTLKGVIVQLEDETLQITFIGVLWDASDGTNSGAYAYADISWHSRGDLIPLD